MREKFTSFSFFLLSFFLSQPSLKGKHPCFYEQIKRQTVGQGGKKCETILTIGHNTDVGIMFTKPPEGNWIMKHIDATTPSAEIDHSGNRPIDI